MTTEHHVSRTLVKSPPELWAECSDAATLARHIGEFGEIRITRLEPETTVDWEGERASGTVEIEPSGWGTRVTLTALTESDQADEASVQEVDAGAVDEPAERPIGEHEPVEEDPHAKVEEALAQPDPAVATGRSPGRRRWARLIDRTRAWFTPRPAELDPAGAPITDEELSLAEPEPPVAEPEPPVAEPEPPVAEPAPPVAEPASAESEASEPAASALELLGAEATEAEPPAPEGSEATEPGDAVDPEAILRGALDSLGQAHHRPFSRA